VGRRKIDDGNEQDSNEAKGEQEMEECAGVIMAGGGQRVREGFCDGAEGGELGCCEERHDGMTRIVLGKSLGGGFG